MTTQTDAASPQPAGAAEAALARVKRVYVAVQGVGDQFRFETIQAVATRLSAYYDAPAPVPLDRRWPGNCGGNLIKDLLLYFRPGLVFDPMSGSGTCRDVCAELGIPCLAWDIHDGFDACDPAQFGAAGAFDFVWCHPPYWRQKLYAADPRDLSRAPTLEDFLHRYGRFLGNCARSLRPGGRLAVLMGDYSDREAGFVPLTYHTKRLAFAAGLRQCCTDIVRFSHGAGSSRKVYRSSFIPGLHDNQSPHTLQDILEEALEPWLRDHGYVK